MLAKACNGSAFYMRHASHKRRISAMKPGFAMGIGAKMQFWPAGRLEDAQCDMVRWGRGSARD